MEKIWEERLREWGSKDGRKDWRSRGEKIEGVGEERWEERLRE